MRKCNISLCHEKFGVYIPPRALCCALGDPSSRFIAFLRMTHCAVRCLTTGRRNTSLRELSRPLQESNIPHVRRTNVGLFGMFAHEFFVSFRPSQQRRVERVSKTFSVLAHMFAQTLLCVNVTFPCVTKGSACTNRLGRFVAPSEIRSAALSCAASG